VFCRRHIRLNNYELRIREIGVLLLRIVPRAIQSIKIHS
jgi:hypothetical protein